MEDASDDRLVRTEPRFEGMQTSEERQRLAAVFEGLPGGKSLDGLGPGDLEALAERFRDVAAFLELRGISARGDGATGKGRGSALATTNATENSVPRLYTPEGPSYALEEKLKIMTQRAAEMITFFGEGCDLLNRRDQMVLFNRECRDILAWDDVLERIRNNPDLQRAINELEVDSETGVPLVIPDFAAVMTSRFVSAFGSGKKRIDHSYLVTEVSQNVQNLFIELGLQTSRAEGFSSFAPMMSRHNGVFKSIRLAIKQPNNPLLIEKDTHAFLNHQGRLTSGELGANRAGWIFCDAMPIPQSRGLAPSEFINFCSTSSHYTGLDMCNALALFLAGQFPSPTPEIMTNNIRVRGSVSQDCRWVAQVNAVNFITGPNHIELTERFDSPVLAGGIRQVRVT